MNHLFKISILLIVALLAFSSCGDEPDGKWDEMEWINVDNLAQVNNIYVIPEEGGTFTFECKNYTPWLSRVFINNDPRPIIDREDLHEKWTKCIVVDWVEIEIVDKKIIVSFDRIEDYMSERKLTVEVTAGDIFDTFVFLQQKKL